MTEQKYTLDRQDGLTSRERQVLDLLATGSTSTQAAAALGVSKARVNQLATALVSKGRLTKEGGRYKPVVTL